MRRTINRIMAIMAVAAMAFATGGCVEPLDNNVRGFDPDAVYLPIRLYIPGAIPTTKVSTSDVKGISDESKIHTVQVWMFSHMDPALLTQVENETQEQIDDREAALNEHAVAYAEARNLREQGENLSDGSGYYINATGSYSGGWVDANTYQIPLVLPKQVLELPAEDMKFDFYVLANAPSIEFEAGKTATRRSLMNATFGLSEENDPFGTSSPIISIADKGLPISGFFNKGNNGETVDNASGVDLSSLRNRTNFTAAELHEILPIVQLERAVSRIRFAFAKPYEANATSPTELEITSITIYGGDEGLIPTSTFVFPRENGGFELPAPITYVKTDAVVTGNNSAFVSSTDIQAKSLLENPEDLKPDSPKVFSNVDSEKSYYNKAPGGNNTTTPETPAMDAQQYSDLLDDYTASKFVYFRECDKKVITGKIEYKVNGLEQVAKPFSIVIPEEEDEGDYNNFHRNHSWTVYAYLKDNKKLDIYVGVRDWIPQPKSTTFTEQIGCENVRISGHIESGNNYLSNLSEVHGDTSSDDYYSKYYQVRTLKLNTSNPHFVVKFRPFAPLGGYWRLDPEFIGEGSSEKFDIRVFDGETYSSELVGQIMNTDVEIHIYPKNFPSADENEPDYAMIFKCFFSPTINFEPSFSADSEFQDVHSDGRYSYWRFTLSR